jgi:peptidyl-prolyl cis-trans isomerase SurA
VRRLRVWLALTVLVAGIGLGPGSPRTVQGSETLIDGIAAQVGYRYVLISEVEELAQPIAERMRAANAPPAQIDKVRGEALDRLIEAKLIESIVIRLEMGATQEEVDETVRNIALDNGLSVAQLQASVESHGLTMNEYRGKLKSELERSRLLNSLVRSQVRVEQEELELAYLERYGDQRQGGEQANLRHILVAAGDQSGRDERTACLIAQDAADQIRAGDMEFREMARRVTEMNPEQEGELGWFHTDEIAPWMAEAIVNMQDGDVSDAIPMPFGCNVLQLVGRRTFSPVSFEAAEPQLREELSQHEMEKEYLRWLETVRKQVYVSRKGIYAEASSRP